MKVVPPIWALPGLKRKCSCWMLKAGPIDHQSVIR